MVERELTGRSIIGGVAVPEQGTAHHFRANDPATGVALEPAFQCAQRDEVERAALLADDVTRCFGRESGKARAALLDAVAGELERRAEPIVERAVLETALPSSRLQGELGRTAGQLRMFAELVAEGSWVDARIDHGDPDRLPLPAPDVRSMLRPLGPVAVFGASNFPLAFSVAGVDTVAALAAGNPVIVKAHPAHPGTSELVGWAIVEALRTQDVSPAAFALLFDAGTKIGSALVDHPLIRAVGFTGSHAGGRALMDRAAARADPIPVFAEMGSINPLFLLPGALAVSAPLAEALVGSLLLGVGQYCTNPGLWVAPDGPLLDDLVGKVRERLQRAPAGTMLSRSIGDDYGRGVDALAAHAGVELLARGDPVEPSAGATGLPALLATDAEVFAAHPELHRELFGPAALLVRCRDEAAMMRVARSLRGQLSATVWGTEPELEQVDALRRVLERKAGRLLFNGVPTGVEICPAMVHGGPYPATADGRTSSVGTRAIERFVRPVAYQGYPDGALPLELREDNPLGIWRLVDGCWGQH